MRPRRTLNSLLAKLERLSVERDREIVEQLAPARRYACERHAFHPAGPGSANVEALASLCPQCIGERKQREREAETPETHTLDLWSGGPVAAKLWQEHRDRLERQDVILGGSAAEREICRALDEARQDELYELSLTARDRARTHADHWQRRLRHERPVQVYTPGPARAGR